MDLSKLFDSIGEVLGFVIAMGGVLIGLPSFLAGFILGRLASRQAPAPSPAD